MTATATATAERPAVFGKRLAAGVALAELQPDGTVIVRNVPLMSEVRPEDPGVKDGARQPRDKAWLEGAVARAKERAKLGKLPIMNLRHYQESPSRVGVYEPDRVELAEVNPDEKPRWTIMGTKVYRDRAAFAESKDYDLRSVEVSPDSPDELGALALLRDKESYFKYPLLSERLAPEAREAFRSRWGVAPQLWQGAVETFAARSTFDEGGLAQMAGKFADPETRREAGTEIGARFGTLVLRAIQLAWESFERDAVGTDWPATMRAAVDKLDEEDGKMPRYSHPGPDGDLPPAVSQARPGETFAASYRESAVECLPGESHTEAKIRHARERAQLARPTVETFRVRAGESYGAARAREARSALEEAQRGGPARARPLSSMGEPPVIPTPAPLRVALELYGARPEQRETDRRSIVDGVDLDPGAAPRGVRREVAHGRPRVEPRNHGPKGRAPLMVSAVELARLAPTGLAALATRGTYQRPAHIAFLERRLLDVSAGRCRRLRVATAPRHGRVGAVARWFLAHWIMSNPTKRAILVCATASLAETYSRKVRDLVLEFGPIFGAKLRSDSRAVDRWDLVQGGGLIAAGAGSSIVGRGADLLVADDVVSGFEVASSKAQLEKLVEWFRRDVLTRLEPGGSALVCGTRWAERDLHGTLEAEERAGGEKWESLILPALSEGEDVDPLKRPAGAALWPQRYDTSELLRIKSALGSHAFEGLYQQRPIPLEGGSFKTAWTKRYRLEEGDSFDSFGRRIPAVRFLDTGQVITLANMDVFLTVDTAVTDASAARSSRADFTAIAAWALYAGRLLLLDLDMRKIDGAKIAEAIRAMSQKHNAVAWIEATTMSKHLLSFLAAEGVVFREIKPLGSKAVRAIPATALAEQGRLYLPEVADYLAEAEHQLYSFSGGIGGGAHDDFVDCLSMAAKVATEELAPATVFEAPRVPPKQYLPPGVSPIGSASPFGVSGGSPFDALAGRGAALGSPGRGRGRTGSGARHGP